MNPFAPTLAHAVSVDIAFWFPNGWPWLLCAFLIGSIPFGLVVSRVFFKSDIRSAGSGNIGAANALRTLGTGAGIAVLLLDASKGIVAVALPVIAFTQGWIHPPYPNAVQDPSFTMQPRVLGALCGICAILGHCYSPWLRFKGGKGVATFLGVLVIGYWESAFAFAVVWLLVVLPTGLASLGSILGTLAAVALIAYLRGPASLYLSLPAAAIIIFQHRENIARLIAGKENRLDLLKRRTEPT